MLYNILFQVKNEKWLDRAVESRDSDLHCGAMKMTDEKHSNNRINYSKI